MRHGWRSYQGAPHRSRGDSPSIDATWGWSSLTRHTRWSVGLFKTFVSSVRISSTTGRTYEAPATARFSIAAASSSSRFESGGAMSTATIDILALRRVGASVR